LPRSSPSRLSALVLGGIGFGATATGIAAVIVWSLSAGDHPITGTFMAFAIFVAVGDLLEVPLERTAVFSLALAPGLAFVLLGPCPGSKSGAACSAALGGQIGQVAAVFISGIALAIVVRALTHRPVRLPVVSARLLVVLGGAATYEFLASRTSDRLAFGPNDISVPGLIAMILCVTALDVALQAALMTSEEDRPYFSLVLDQARATGSLLLSSVSVAALLALSYPALRAWTLPLFLAPLAATQYSFQQVATIRRNYLQTVGALAKVPEMAGYTEAGHSRRVADLSVAIAKELGIVDPELHEIEYGALLHDIGRISLPDPEEAAKSTSNLQLALVGAGIIEETGHLPTVAKMVRDQHEPYRRRGEETNKDLSLGAKIIKVASAFDDFSEPPGPGRTHREAVERLYLGMAYDYDPQVIQALTRVLERQGNI
jgi:putative nucleotidyltransferase with HDIG domain